MDYACSEMQLRESIKPSAPGTSASAAKRSSAGGSNRHNVSSAALPSEQFQEPSKSRSSPSARGPISMRSERGLLFGYTRAVATEYDAAVIFRKAAGQQVFRLRIRSLLLVLSVVAVLYNACQVIFFPDNDEALISSLVNTCCSALSCILVTMLYQSHGLFSPLSRWVQKHRILSGFCCCFGGGSASVAKKRSLHDPRELANLSAHARLSKVKYVGEMLLYAIHCPPGVYEFAPILRVLDFTCTFRILFSVVVVAVNYTRFKRLTTRILANLGGVPYDAVGLSRLAIRWILRRHPFRVLVPFVLFAWSVLAFSFHYVEPYDLGTSYWFILATASTVGYGDVVPTTWKGRAVAGCGICFGLFLVGYLVNAVQSTIRLNCQEERLYTIEYYLRQKQLVRKAAADLIGKAWRLSELHKTFSISNNDHRHSVETSKALNSGVQNYRRSTSSRGIDEDENLLAAFSSSFWGTNSLHQLDALEAAVDSVQVSAARFRLLRKELVTLLHDADQYEDLPDLGGFGRGRNTVKHGTVISRRFSRTSVATAAPGGGVGNATGGDELSVEERISHMERILEQQVELTMKMSRAVEALVERLDANGQ